MGLLMVCAKGCEGGQHTCESGFGITASSTVEFSILDRRFPGWDAHGVDADGVHMGFEQEFFRSVFSGKKSKYVIASGEYILAASFHAMSTAEVFYVVCHGTFSWALGVEPDWIEGVDAVDANEVAEDSDGIEGWHVGEFSLRIMFWEGAGSLEVGSKIVRYSMVNESSNKGNTPCMVRRYSMKTITYW